MSVCFLCWMAAAVGSRLCRSVCGSARIKRVCSLALWKSCFSVVEGLDRHVLAGSLFSGTGEQASGRVDVPGKDIQQQAAATKETPSICFFVKSLGGAFYVVKIEHQATVARVRQHVALKSWVFVDAFYLGREGKVLRDENTLESLEVCDGTRNCTCVPIFVVELVMGRQPQIPGQCVCQSCGCWSDAAELLSVRCAVATRGMGGQQALQGVSLPWTA